jgi:peptidoglycan-N-acetylglucosamine deacetylase
VRRQEKQKGLKWNWTGIQQTKSMFEGWVKMRNQMTIFLPGLILLFGIAACVPQGPVGPTATQAPTASATLQPTTSLTPQATTTATASATATPIPPTATVTPIYVPTLPHTDIHFIKSGSRDLPYVALTFDLCQKPELPASFDQDIVDVLVQYNVPATFFMGGHWMATHPAQTRQLAAIPFFELGNHSWSHPDMVGLDETTLTQEIMKTQQELYALTGKQARLFRMPAGKYDTLALIMLAWHGLYVIQWDADSADPVPENDATMMSALVEKRVQNGSIVLMHANGRGWHTAEALPLIIADLRAKGYTFVTVPQLIGLDPLPDGSWAGPPVSMLP